MHKQLYEAVKSDLEDIIEAYDAKNKDNDKINQSECLPCGKVFKAEQQTLTIDKKKCEDKAVKTSHKNKALRTEINSQALRLLLNI